MDPITIKLASIATHLKEHIDTGEFTDLKAAEALMDDEEVSAWVAENKVLMPLRRDGLSPL